MLNKRDEVKIISEAYYNKMRELLVGKTTASRLVDDKGKVLLPKGEKISLEQLNETRTATGTRSSSTAETARSRSSSSSSPRSVKRTSSTSRRSTRRRSRSSPRATSSPRA